MLFLMMLTVVDVTGRSIFNKPLRGADELAELTLGCIVFLLLPAITYKKGHIAVDLVGRKADGTIRMILDIAAAVIGFLVFALVGWRLAHLATTALRYGDATASLQVPLAPIFYLIAVLSVVNACASLATIPGAIRARYSRHEATQSEKTGQ